MKRDWKKIYQKRKSEGKIKPRDWKKIYQKRKPQQIERWKQDGPRLNAQKRKQSKIDRIICLKHYSNNKLECICCGENEIIFLAIDHINGRKSMNHKNTFSGTVLYIWIIKNNFPKGFQVLCWNCNWGKHILGICPHIKI